MNANITLNTLHASQSVDGYFYIEASHILTFVILYLSYNGPRLDRDNSSGNPQKIDTLRHFGTVKLTH